MNVCAQMQSEDIQLQQKTQFPDIGEVALTLTTSQFQVAFVLSGPVMFLTPGCRQ